MPPVLSIVGSSDSGKTRVAEGLIGLLAARGYRVAAVKHCPHGHDVDRPGSDTDRLRRAGATAIVAASPGKLTRIERTEGDTPLEAIAASFGPAVDLVVGEGFKGSAAPKVLVFGGPDGAPSVVNVIATVGAGRAGAGLPDYRMEDLAPLADFVVEQLILEPAT